MNLRIHLFSVKKAFEPDQNLARAEMIWDTRDGSQGSHPNSPMAVSTPVKRKASDGDREPESPLEVERQHAPTIWHRNKEFQPMNTDSPASYPKHVMVPSESNERYPAPPSSSKDTVSTPILSNEHDSHNDFENPMYRASNNFGFNERSNAAPRDYMEELEPPSSYVPPREADNYIEAKAWACDHCGLQHDDYEEALKHERTCEAQYHNQRYGNRGNMSRGGPSMHYDYHGQQPAGGLGAFSHDGGHQMWNSRGPSLPSLPETHQSNHYNYHQPHHSQRYHQPHQNHFNQHPQYHHQRHHGYNHHSRYPNHGNHGYHPYHGLPSHGNRYEHHSQAQQKPRMLLAMPTDQDSLSDRQCYVRSQMVEIFAAGEHEVNARHSKGAQKLNKGQVGIRCVHCAHLRPRDRAERAVCYPSSISRIYQTVADMQRFHFEQCREIPHDIRKIYKSLKTTRPRGVGSPQTYWIQSAKLLDLVDTKEGIKFARDVKSTSEVADVSRSDAKDTEVKESA